MKLVCGLGNPGKEYEMTRHNIGFMVIDSYCKDEKFSKKFNGLYLEKSINNTKVIFLKPQSYMNLSGEVVKPFCDYFKIDTKDVLIIRDDLDLPLGTARIKYDSSSGGDNGVKSIISHLGTQQFYQLKIGISNDKHRDTKEYVLGNFSKNDFKIINEVINNSSDIIDRFLNDDLHSKENYIYGDRT